MFLRGGRCVYVVLSLVLALSFATPVAAASDDVDSVVDRDVLQDELEEENLGKIIDRQDIVPLLDEAEIVERVGERRIGKVLRPGDLSTALQDRKAGDFVSDNQRASFGSLFRDVKIRDIRPFMDDDELGELVQDRNAWRILEELDVAVLEDRLSDREVVSLTDSQRFEASIERDEMYLVREMASNEKVEDMVAPEDLDTLGSTVLDDEDIDRILDDDDLMRVITDDDISSSIDREALIDAIDRDKLGERLKDERFSEISAIVDDDELDRIVDRERLWERADRNDRDEIVSIVSDNRIGDVVGPRNRGSIGELLTDAELREILHGDASPAFNDMEAGEVMDDRDIGRIAGSTEFGNVAGFLDSDDLSSLHSLLKDERMDSVFTDGEMQQLVADGRVDAAAVVEDEELGAVIQDDVSDEELGALLSDVELGELLDDSEISNIIENDALGDLENLVDEGELGRLVQGTELRELLSDDELADILKEKRVGELVNRGDIDVSPPSPGTGRTDTPSADSGEPATDQTSAGADVEIASFSAPSSVRAGQTLDVVIDVENRGRESEVSAGVRAFGQFVESDPATLSHGETGEFTVSVTVPSDASGPERLQVEARALESGGVVERDVATSTLTVSDVAASMKVYPSSTQEGRTIKVSGIVSPSGPSTVPVNVYLDGSYRGTVTPDPGGHYTQTLVAEREGRNVVEIRADGARQQKIVTVLPILSITSSSIPSKVNTGEEMEVCVTIDRSSTGAVNLDLFVDEVVVAEKQVTADGDGEQCISTAITEAGVHDVRVRAVSGPGNDVSDSATGTVEAVEPVESATVFPAGLTLVTGENGVFSVTLENHAAEAQAFDIEVEGLEIASLTHKTVSVRSGESRTVTVPVRPEQSGRYSGTITVLSGSQVLEDRTVTVRAVENPALKNPVVGGAVQQASATVERFRELAPWQKWSLLGTIALSMLLAAWYWRRRGRRVIEPQY